MVKPSNKNLHLTSAQRSLIEYELKTGKSPEKIIESWRIDIHNRPPPSIRTIFSIKRQVENGESVEPQKKGPKSKHVLSPEKLMEVEKAIQNNNTITFRNLSELVQLPLSTTHLASDILGFKGYEAIVEEKLTEQQKIQRLEFCRKFLCWNNGFKMMVWWSDESLFCVDEINKYRKTSYIAQENEYMIFEKEKNQKKINVWAAIRGDGRLIYRILDGIQYSHDYIQLLINVFPEMEFQNSFLMQDGAGIHTSKEAVEWINWLWEDRWIGLKSPRLEFPPKSMDLTPMDFSFWSYIKRKISARKLDSIEELLNSIHHEMSCVPKKIIQNMCNNVAERCRKCISMEGGRFEGK